MAEGAAGSRDAKTANSTMEFRPAALTIKLENACLKDYLVDCQVLRVLRSLSAYGLAFWYLSGIEGFCSGLDRALRCVALAARLFTIIYLHGGEWTYTKLARKAGRCGQNMHKALTNLERAGLAARSSMHRWRLTISRPSPLLPQRTTGQCRRSGLTAHS